jgi:beta-carotene 3-hydroxylase
MMTEIMLFILFFILMEFVARYTHKYVMHGLLWSLHRDHHVKPDTHNSFFERNDAFFLIFALPAIVLLITGFAAGNSNPVAIGAGITLYGFTYFTIHDVIIHKRLPFPMKKKGRYLEALIRAHEGHHSPSTRTEFLSFGLLIFPAKYFRE